MVSLSIRWATKRVKLKLLGWQQQTLVKLKLVVTWSPNRRNRLILKKFINLLSVAINYQDY
jgi:hypothetical protein